MKKNKKSASEKPTRAELARVKIANRRLAVESLERIPDAVYDISKTMSKLSRKMTDLIQLADWAKGGLL